MRKLLVCILLSVVYQTIYAQLTINQMLCEQMNNPVGISTSKPRFIWKINASIPSTKQVAYELTVKKGKKIVWATGKVATDQSVFVQYNGQPLDQDTKYNWQVRVWDNHGNLSPWSSLASFQTAFFDSSAWKAKWISLGFEEDKKNRPAQYYRSNFQIKKEVAQATAYITSQGMYQAFINGKKIGDAYLTPGWTSYKKRLQYQAYDVSSLLQKGKNALGAVIGNGWFRGTLGWTNNVDIYGKELGLLMQLNVVYTDGSRDYFVTDEHWKSSYGAILANEIYHGEEIDARKDQAGWDLPDFNDSQWQGVKILNTGYKHLIATENEKITVHENIHPVNIFTTPKGEKVLDFGQNLVGWVKVKANGKSGDAVVIKHAEVLDKLGNFYTENMRSAKTTATYILSGKKDEEFQPHFTFFGFRYIKVEGYPGEIKPENFTAMVLHSDMQSTGTFSSSNPLVNQLQHNIQWGKKEIFSMYLLIVRNAMSVWVGQEMHRFFQEPLHLILMFIISLING